MAALTSRPSMSRISSSTPSAISTMPEQPHVKEAAEKRRARAASNTAKPLDGILESTHRHTWLLPGAISAVIFSLWLLFGPYESSNPFNQFIVLSYRVVNRDGDICYGKGGKDLVFCAYYAVVFLFLRELTMEKVLEPLATKLMANKSKRHRLMEQCFAVVHYSIGGLCGLVYSYTSKLT